MEVTTASLTAEEQEVLLNALGIDPPSLPYHDCYIHLDGTDDLEALVELGSMILRRLIHLRPIRSTRPARSSEKVA